jgi:hypothetical protein
MLILFFGFALGMFACLTGIICQRYYPGSYDETLHRMLTILYCAGIVFMVVGVVSPLFRIGGAA